MRRERKRERIDREKRKSMTQKKLLRERETERWKERERS